VSAPHGEPNAAAYTKGGVNRCRVRLLMGDPRGATRMHEGGAGCWRDMHAH